MVKLAVFLVKFGNFVLAEGGPGRAMGVGCRAEDALVAQQCPIGCLLDQAVCLYVCMYVCLMVCVGVCACVCVCFRVYVSVPA